MFKSKKIKIVTFRYIAQIFIYLTKIVWIQGKIPDSKLHRLTCTVFGVSLVPFLHILVKLD